MSRDRLKVFVACKRDATRWFKIELSGENLKEDISSWRGENLGGNWKRRGVHLEGHIILNFLDSWIFAVIKVSIVDQLATLLSLLYTIHVQQSNGRSLSTSIFVFCRVTMLLQRVMVLHRICFLSRSSPVILSVLLQKLIPEKAKRRTS